MNANLANNNLFWYIIYILTQEMKFKKWKLDLAMKEETRKNFNFI